MSEIDAANAVRAAWRWAEMAHEQRTSSELISLERINELIATYGASEAHLALSIGVELGLAPPQVLTTTRVIDTAAGLPPPPGLVVGGHHAAKRAAQRKDESK